MKSKLLIVTYLILVISCQSKINKETSNIDSLQIEDSVAYEIFIYNEYKSDSVTIDVKNDNYKFSILLNIGRFSKEYNFEKLNIPVKNPPDLYWTNKDYACMVTWYSQAQSRHIFIPFKQENEFIYLDKDIEEMDSINNNIVYIDSISENSDIVIFKVENLLTRKNKSMSFRIDRYNGNYPFYESINLTKNKLTIKTAYEKQSVNIKDLSTQKSTNIAKQISTNIK